MKLTDIVTEQQLDELDVAGGIARGLGAVAKGAGALAGVPGGMAAQYQKGKAAAKAAIAGQNAPDKAAPETDMYGNPKSIGGSAGTTVNPKSKAALDQITQLVGDLDPSDIPAVSALLQKGSTATSARAPANAAPAVAPQAAQAKPTSTTTAPSAGAKPLAPQTPDQIRAAKQATASAAAQAQMKANPAPAKTAPQTPDQIRAAKQADAAKAAQDNMAANAAPTAGTPPAANFNNQLAGGKQTISTATPKPTANTTQDGQPHWDPATDKGAKYDGVTGEPTPAWKAAQDKKAADATAAATPEPGAAAFGNMAKTLTQEPKAAPTASTAAPAAADTAQTTTGGKLTPAQQAAMKAKLQGQRSAGKTAGTTSSGFNQYTKDASSQRIVGANPDGSPKIQTIKAGKINTGNNLSEMLAANIAKQKKKIAEEQTAIYENSSIFTK